jgi:hypothetical protein
VVPIDLGEIRQLAVRRLQRARVGQLQLLGDVGRPAFTETLPGEHVHRPLTQQRPERRLNGAGIRGRHDGDFVVSRNAEDRPAFLDDGFEFGFAGFGAMRAAEEGA